MKNDEIKARDSLKWYRGQIYEDDVEMKELRYLAIVSQSKKVKCLTLLLQLLTKKKITLPILFIQI